MKAHMFSRKSLFFLGFLALLTTAGGLNFFKPAGISAASPQTVFSNPAPITIGTVPTPAPLVIPSNPYPSTISVAGLTGTTTKVKVSLRGFSHEVRRQMDFLLVSPTGEKYIFLSDAGGDRAQNVDITFDDDAAASYPINAPLFSGTYKPVNVNSGLNDTFPAPAPAGPYNSPPNATLDGTFGGADPNGEWSLYATNTGTFSDLGSLDLGWALTITTTADPATTFVNPNYVELSWVTARANPYGSTINVAGLAGVISDLKVTLNGVTHGRAEDINVLLVSPNGTALILMADAASGGAANDADIIFDDAATEQLPSSGPLVSGTYRPRNFSDCCGSPRDSDTFPAPAPSGPYLFSILAFSLAQFDNISPNGDWTLYVIDDRPGEAGEIAGGWSLDITTEPYVPVEGGCLLPTLSFTGNFPVGSGPTGIAVGDFNNDQSPDLVVANQISNDVTVLLNNGAGSFADQPALTAGSSPYAVAVGRFDGDTDDDIAVVNSASNNVSVFLGNGDGTFSAAAEFNTGPTPVSVAVGDFDNDSNEDLAIANFGGFFSGTVSILRGDGNGGFALTSTLRTRNQPSYVAAGDLTGDSIPDLAVASFGSNSVGIYINNGSGGFSLRSNLMVGAGPVHIDLTDLNDDNDLDLFVANYNGDSVTIGDNDGRGNFPGVGSVPVGLNPTAAVVGNFTGNETKQIAASLSATNQVSFGIENRIGVGDFPFSLVKADFNSDGQLDIATSNSDSNNVSVLLNSCTVAIGNIFDFNRDQRTDYAVFRPARSEWFSAAFGTQAPKNFGKPTDTLVPADYDGDGQTDYGVFRPEGGLWRIIDRFDRPIYFLQFGLADDIPVPADYDGDKKADIAVWRPSDGNWYVRRSTDNALQIFPFGMDGDRPVPADYDGDGLADYAVFRPSTGVWFIRKSSDGNFLIFGFGVDTDQLVPGDYDGDRRADVAVWRPSTGVWYILRSTDGGFTILQFGIDGDRPVPGDYDGDGRYDLAVFRPAEGNWYVRRSSDSAIQVFGYGLGTDIPIPNVFVR